MRMRMPGPVFVSVFVLVFFAICAPAGAQVGSLPNPPSQPRPPSQTPARDPRTRQPATGTGVIRGRVVDGQTGQALVHARLRLMVMSGAPDQPRSALTDASGIFEFTKVPAGRFMLMAGKGGYTQVNYPESARTVRSARSPTILAEGQTMDNVTITLYRGSAITGRVVDSYGDPVENANVQVLPAPGYGTLRSFSGGSVNDAGEFRLGRLQPGAYLVVAMPGGRGMGETDPTTIVPTYYPGVLSPDQAQPIMVERGQTVSGIDFQVGEQPVTLVTGMVTDSTGQPSNGGRIQVANATAGVVLGFAGGAQIRPDGTFELRLAPGSYRIDAYSSRRDAGRDGGNTRPAQFEDQQQIGMARITVGPEPIANLVISTGGGGTISGRIVFDGDGERPDANRITVTAHNQRSATPGIGPQRNDDCRAKQGKVNPADMTFAIEGVYGLCVLDVNINGGNGRWLLRSALYRDADLLDRPIEVTNQQHASDVQVIYSNKRGEVSAEVTDEQGAPTQEYVLLVFSTDKARWSLVRYVATASRAPAPSATAQSSSPGGMVTASLSMSTSGGNYVAGSGMPVSSDPGMAASARNGVISWLPLGDYYAVALDDLVLEDIHDPAYLDQLVAHATRVSLREGESQTLQLRRMQAPPSAVQRSPR